MTTFWCPWCGSSEESASAEDIVPCRRCAAEFGALFGFCPRTDMVPLKPDEAPGEPVAARKRFVFYDAESGEEIGATARARRVAIVRPEGDPMCA